MKMKKMESEGRPLDEIALVTTIPGEFSLSGSRRVEERERDRITW